jgi:hypothetical protein
MVSVSGKRHSELQRQLGRNALHAEISLCGDRYAENGARQWRAIWQSSEDLAVRKSEWWRTQSLSNVSLHGYSLLSGKRTGKIAESGSDSDLPRPIGKLTQ